MYFRNSHSVCTHVDLDSCTFLRNTAEVCAMSLQLRVQIPYHPLARPHRPLDPEKEQEAPWASNRWSTSY